MQNLRTKIITNWERHFAERYVDETLKQRDVVGQYRFEIMYSKFKEDYYNAIKNQQPEAKKDNDEFKKSPFRRVIANPEKYHGFIYDNFVVYPNTIPSTKYHIIMVALEFRPKITKQDILKLMKFARETGYTVFLSITGSGATAPSHFHAQAHLQEFPIYSSDRGAKFQKIDCENDYCVQRINYAAAGVRIVGKQEMYEKATKHLENIQTETPFNILTKGNELLVFPRTKEVPSMFEGWQMGGLEMGGRFCTRSYEVFSSLDYKTLEAALKEVTFSNEKLEEFERKLIGALK